MLIDDVLALNQCLALSMIVDDLALALAPALALVLVLVLVLALALALVPCLLRYPMRQKLL